MFFKLLFFFITTYIFSDSKVKLESVDINKFPLIHLYVSENKLKPIQGENIHIIETKDGVTKQVHSLSILKLNKLRPIKLILSIQATENQKKLDYVKQVSSLLIQSLSSDDRIGIQVFGNDTYFLSLSLNKTEALSKIESITNAKGNRVLNSLNFLLTQVNDNDMPSICFVFSSDVPAKQDEKISTIIEKSRAENLPLNFFSIEDDKYLSIADYSGGEFFPLDKNKSVTEIQSKLYDFRKTLPILEYKSPFSESQIPIKKSIIDIQLRVGNSEIKTKYELNIYNFIKFKLSNIEFFYTFMFIILLVCILVLYAVTSQINKKNREEELRIREEELLSNDLYYHENLLNDDDSISTFENYSSREEDDEDEIDDSKFSYSPTESFQTNSNSQTKIAVFPIDEISNAESYSRGILIIKEGPNPGRQFTINKDEISIGNTASNDLVLIDSSISPMHAKIKKIKDVFILFDTVSKSGVILNGNKLLRPKPLYDFDEIKLGKVVLLFRGK